MTPQVGDRVQHRRTGHTGRLLRIYGQKRKSVVVSYDRGGQGIGYLRDLIPARSLTTRLENPMATDLDLLSTPDAMVWAEAFCRQFEGKIVTTDESNGIDPGTMVGWFANAMAAWENAERPGMEPVGLNKLQVCDLAFTVAGAATAPFMRDNPKYVFPADEVSDAVAEVLREQLGIEPSRIRGYWGVNAPADESERTNG